MAVTFSFADRFSYPNPDGISSDISASDAQALTDAEIEAVSPALAEMAAMVRQYSVLLKRTRTLEIFNTITRQTDPRVALVLSSARRKSNNFSLFKGLDEVRRVMFNDSDRSPEANEVLNTSLFSDGIRRVSAALCAAILIGQLPEVQREFALEIEKRALEDLDRVCATYELSGSADNKTDKTSEPAPIAFYFEPLDFELDSDQVLAVEWYSPSYTTNWVPVQTYTGALSTWNVVADLADAINIYTAQDIDSTLLAVAELSGPIVNSQYLHTLSFYPRKPLNGFLGHSINVRIEIRPASLAPDPTLVIGGTSDNLAESGRERPPFKWGPHSTSIKDYPINGSILVAYFNKVAALTPDEMSDYYVPTVLYFRNKYDYSSADFNPPSSSILRFRLQPWQPNLAPAQNLPVEIEIDFPRLISDDPQKQLELDRSRYSQLALVLLNGLADINLATKAAGCIIRNDSLQEVTPLSAVELVAWGLSKVMTHIILDVLEIPEDLEMSTGSLLGPSSNFSSNPRTLRVSVQNQPYLGSLGAELGSVNEGIRAVPKQQARVWQTILDEAATVEEQRWY